MKNAKRVPIILTALLLFGCETEQVVRPEGAGPAERPTMRNPAGQLGPPWFDVETPAIASKSSSTTWVVGDLFVAVTPGTYQVYDNTGVFKETISDGIGGFTTGCAFSADLDSLDTTNFSTSQVVVYDDPSPHSVIQIVPTGLPQAESVVFAANKHFFVGSPFGGIEEYTTAGVLVDTDAVVSDGTGGTDWMDLASDQKTIFFTAEGRNIHRYDVVNDVQLANFATLPGNGSAFALRLLPPGDGSGGLIVADGFHVVRLDGTGAVAQIYDVAGGDCWFAMSLDPNGTSFWAADVCTSDVYRFNIATGAVELSFNTGTSTFTVFGLCVKGEPTAASVVTVDVDVKPGSDPNSINCNNAKEVIAVAILTTDDFDATTVDHATVEFQGAGETHVDKKSGQPRRHEEDVDGDGDTDLVLHFRLGDTDLTCASTEGVLTGETFGGQAIKGTDAVRMVGG